MVTWGGYLGNSEAVQEQLVSVKHIYSTLVVEEVAFGLFWGSRSPL